MSQSAFNLFIISSSTIYSDSFLSQRERISKMRRKNGSLKSESGRLKLWQFAVICEGKLLGHVSMTQTLDKIKGFSVAVELFPSFSPLIDHMTGYFSRTPVAFTHFTPLPLLLHNTILFIFHNADI